MAEFPALPLWTDAYLGDTTHLTTIEHGAYLLLLMAAWRTDGTRLPDEDRKLARFARLGPQQWARIKPIMLDFFDVSEGWWTQRRLTDEASAVRQRRDAQAANGRASALKRKGRHSTKRPAKREPNDQPNANQLATPTPTPTSVTIVTGADAPPADPVKELFDAGVDLLMGAGMDNAKARRLVGKWRKAGEAKALAAIIAARDRGVTNPAAWIAARLHSVSEDEDEERANSRATAERYRRLNIPGPPPERQGEFQ